MSRTGKRVRTAIQARLAAARQANAGTPLLEAPRPWPPFREVDLDVVERSSGRPRPAGVVRAYTNGWFAVFVRPLGDGGVHLLIRNLPNTPVRSWTDLQRIKSELCGPERLAVEVFPPDADVIDQANMTHLWVPRPDLEAAVLTSCSLYDWQHTTPGGTR